RERDRPVLLRGAFAEHVVIDAVEHQDFFHGIPQYETLATARSSSGVVVPKTKNSRYAGICSNSMSVPIWQRQQRSRGASSSGVISCCMTPSPTNVDGASRATSTGRG